MTVADLAPIGEQDLREVADFLVRELDPGVTAQTWADALRAPWQDEAPNRGFVVRVAGEVVGAYLAFYSRRDVGGATVQICNLGPWCVRETHRAEGLRLLRAVLKQPAYHFTDLSPSGSVVRLNERMGFRHLDTATSLMPNLPWIGRPGQVRITASPAAIADRLEGEDLHRYRDHADLGATHHVLITRHREHCHVIFRQDRRKGLPIFASVLYVSNRALFRSTARHFGRYVLLRHRLPLTLVEERVVGGTVRPGLRLASHRPKMFRSSLLDEQDVDYLYSELMCLPW